MNISIYNYFAPVKNKIKSLPKTKNQITKIRNIIMKMKTIDDNKMDIDDPPQSNSPLIKRKSYSIISKYRILQELKNNKTSKKKKKYNIPISTFKGWKKNEEKYKEQILIKEGNKQRLIGDGRKINGP